MKIRALLALTVSLLASSLRADLKVATLNCYLCFSPANHETIAIADIANGKLSAADYATKIKDLARLATSEQPDVIGLEEIGSDLEAADLAKAMQATWPEGGAWKVCFAQGRDHETGEDVATLVRIKAAKVVKFARDEHVLGKLSKHLVTEMDVGGKIYAVVTVHLVRPMNGQQPHHLQQIDELKTWVAAHNGGEVPVVLGDFNDTGHKLLPLQEASEFTHDAPTHLDRKEYDHIFAPALKAAKVTVPMYGTKPSKHAVSLWTDHYMLSAVIN